MVSVDIISIIDENPGIKFSEIMRKTGLKNGVLSHHLRKLEENGSVKTERTIGNTRYYPLGIGDEEMIVIKHLRQKTFRYVMILLYEHSHLSFRNIVEMTNLSSSGVSCTLSKLVSEGIVHVEFEKRNKLYHIDKKNLIKKIIGMYGSSDMGNIVSRHKSTLTYILLVLSGFSQRLLPDQSIDFTIFTKLSLF